MRPTRREVVVLLLSFLAWSFVELHVKTPIGAIWGGSDHVSHLAQSELFLRNGFDVYRKPATQLCVTPPTAAAAGWASRGGCPEGMLCELRAEPGEPPPRSVCANWQQYPQPYPPGLLLYSLPEALLYEHTAISPRAISAFIIIKYFVAAHVLAWLVFRIVFPASPKDDPIRTDPRAAWGPHTLALRAGLFLLIYLDLMRWTLAGFYDPISMVALFACVVLLAKERPADALLAFAVAVFLHYRALWYLPLGPVAAFRLLRTGGWWSKTAAVKLALTTLLAAVSAYAFLLLFAALKTFPETNPALWHDGRVSKPELDLLLPVAFVLLYLARGRHWLLFIAVAWQAFMISHTPQVMPWHSMFLLPFLGVARLERGRGPMMSAVVFMVAESSAVFGVLPSPGDIVIDLWTTWGPVAL